MKNMVLPKAAMTLPFNVPSLKKLCWFEVRKKNYLKVVCVSMQGGGFGSSRADPQPRGISAACGG